MNITAYDAERIIDNVLSLESIRVFSDMDREDFESVIRDYLDSVTIKATRVEETNADN